MSSSSPKTPTRKHRQLVAPPAPRKKRRVRLVPGIVVHPGDDRVDVVVGHGHTYSMQAGPRDVSALPHASCVQSHWKHGLPSTRGPRLAITARLRPQPNDPEFQPVGRLHEPAHVHNDYPRTSSLFCTWTPDASPDEFSYDNMRQALNGVLQPAMYRKRGGGGMAVVQGRETATLHLNAEPLTLKFNGVSHPSTPAPRIIHRVVDIMRQQTGCNFDWVHVVHYTAGSGGLAYHRDDEKAVAPGSAIACFTACPPDSTHRIIMKRDPAPAAFDKRVAALTRRWASEKRAEMKIAMARRMQASDEA